MAKEVVEAPITGTIISIEAKVGDKVEEGDVLLYIESMKMETTLTAPFGGKVRTVNVAQGDKVMPGQILIDIDKDEVSTKEAPPPG